MMLDRLQAMNRRIHKDLGDPETQTRITQYEMAFRMQSSVPDLVDISGEPKHTLEMYGEDVQKPGTFGHNCLLARRMVERDVRFVRDHHPKCYSIWMAGGGIKGGMSHGETDDFGYNIVKDGVHIRDLNATILNRLGIDSQRYTVKHRGLDERLTGVQEEARPIQELFT